MNNNGLNMRLCTLFLTKLDFSYFEFKHKKKKSKDVTRDTHENKITR